ncbi:DUF547 domain-containing protein [Shewanella electrodiphila]|uniref:DUF547 domain-containing protein n=1 Tax=Shewanella electrodiphila TaxID=934143 RepID=A0ABT0KQQ0_9GAMM|nr:DUF547 domain-containing protein [Shewanella electrodiphila]MCL1046171.1 DUF547 domain-containing protein [Shewanella electrodiphila]
MKKITTQLMCLNVALLTCTGVIASEISDKFSKYDANSNVEILYDDYDAVLKASVLAVGQSTRAKAKESNASIGTRMKVRINKLTALEGNRFFYEQFQDDDNQVLLENIQKSLETVPSEVSLSKLNRDEQLAYWLNLYNLTVLIELIDMYPIKKIDDEFEDDETIFSKKTLTIEGVELSLNDIENEILFKNYDANPIIIYGMYQGNVGGPSIRKNAFTSRNVYQNLRSNASEFINSNRGTYSQGKSTFRVSSLYERKEKYFPEFQSDLTAHLSKYIHGTMSNYLREGPTLKPNINDWKITDLFKSQKSRGMSSAANSAALMDSVGITSGGKGEGVPNASTPTLGLAAEVYSDRGVTYGRFSPEQIEMLMKVDEIRLENAGEVTITDIKTEEQ